jgi:membrane protein
VRSGPRRAAIGRTAKEIGQVPRGRPLDPGPISFRVVLALIPLLLFGVGLHGFLNLEDVWRDDIAGELRPNTSHEVFRVIDDTVPEVLTKHEVFSVTIGAAIAIWELSGAVRAIVKTLNRIYGMVEEREPWRQLILSIVLAAVELAIVLAAIAAVQFGPLLVEELLGEGTAADIVGFALSWGSALLLLVLTVGVLMRAGPDEERPLIWVSYGAALVVGAWIAVSLLFGLYLREIADYSSIYGNLATVFILIEYLHLSSLAFVTGVVVDAMTWRRVEGR